MYAQPDAEYNLDTMLIYVKAHTEQKRKAIEIDNLYSTLGEILNPECFTQTDNVLLKDLYRLK